MKIAMIGQKGIPAKSGGVEKHVEQIGKNIVCKGHQLTVYCRNTYTECNHSVDGIDIKIIKTVNAKSLDAILYTFFSTIHALFNNYDVFHYHAIGPASLSWIPRLLGKKVVVTVHGLDWQREKWGKFATIYLKFGERITGRFANKIIVVSSNLKDYFQYKYKRRDDEVYFIRNGVNLKKYKHSSNILDKFSLQKDKYILFLARLTPEKGAHYLIDAFLRLNTESKLVIAGGSSYTDNYIEQLLEKKSDKIVFTDTVTEKEAIDLYENCLFYVLPSDIEGMPLTLLEAMSLGKACLVSDIKENLDVIKENQFGISFKKGNVNDLYSKLKYLIENPTFVKKLCENSREYIRENYNWNEVATQTIEVYKELVNSRRE